MLEWLLCPRCIGVLFRFLTFLELPTFACICLNAYSNAADLFDWNWVAYQSGRYGFRLNRSVLVTRRLLKQNSCFNCGKPLPIGSPKQNDAQCRECEDRSQLAFLFGEMYS